MYYRKTIDDCLKWRSWDVLLKGPNPARVKGRSSYRMPVERFSTGWPGVREAVQDFRFPYLDPRFDLAFKHIFGKKAHKDLLVDFLDSLFEGRKEIRDLMLCPTEHLSERQGAKTVIYDLLCRGEQGEYFLIEMQRAHQSFFTRRAFHYLSRLVLRPLNSYTRNLLIFAPACAKKCLHNPVMRTFFCIVMNKNK